MLASVVTCVFTLAAAQGAPAPQEAGDGVPPAFVIGLQSVAPESGDDDKKAGEGEGQSDDKEAGAAAKPAAPSPPAATDLDPFSPWGAPEDVAPKAPPTAPVPQTKPPTEPGYTPLPEGKVIPPQDPPPKPVPPPLPDEDRPDPQGMQKPQFPPLLVAPFQVISGVIAGIAMVPVTALTLGLGLCAGPAAIALAEVTFADLVGQKRGTLFWPTVGAYGASAGCSGLYAGGAGLLIALVSTGVISFAAVSPALLISISLVAPLALFPVFAAGNIFVTALAPAILYPYTSEPKNPDDPELHFPGFFSPNHRTPRLPPGTPTAAMRY